MRGIRRNFAFICENYGFLRKKLYLLQLIFPEQTTVIKQLHLMCRETSRKEIKIGTINFLTQKFLTKNLFLGCFSAQYQIKKI